MMDMCYRCMQPAVVDGRCTNCHSPAVQRDPVGDANLLPLGTTLDDGNIVVGDKLGVGGFGITYIAHDSKHGLIALKEFFPSFYVTRQGMEVVPMSDKMEPFNKAKRDFDREVRQLINLRGHPNIVQVLFQIEENNTIYYGMELLQGETLLKYLGRTGPLSPVDAFVLLEPIMSALSFAHRRKCIHRDIAPDNIYLRKDSNMSMGVSPCLIDFGAAFTDEDGFTRVIPNVGKSGFSPIEQASGSDIQGNYTDVYALTATYYYMVTKKIPTASKERAFNNQPLDPPSKYAPAVSPRLDAIIKQGMELNTSARIQSVDELHHRMKAELIPNAPIPSMDDEPKQVIDKPRDEDSFGEWHSEPSVPVPAPVEISNTPPAKKRNGGLALLACILEWAIFAGVAMGVARQKMPDAIIIGVLLAVFINLASLMMFGGATFGMRLAGISTGNGQETPSFGSAFFYSILRALVPLHLLAELIALCSGTVPFTEIMSGIAKAQPAPPAYHPEPKKPHVPEKKPEPAENVHPAPEKPKNKKKPDVPQSPNYLQCISGSMVGQIISLKDEQSIGRETTNNVQIYDDAKVSRSHCRIFAQQGTWYIRDDKSHNGTFVNQRRIPLGEDVRLSSGDMIRIGSEEFVFNHQQ